MFVILLTLRDFRRGQKEGCRWHANGKSNSARAWCFCLLTICFCFSLLVRPGCTSDKRCGSFQMARQKLLLEESKTKRQILSVPQLSFLVYGGHECARTRKIQPWRRRVLILSHHVMLFTFCALAVLSTQVNYRKGKAQRGAFFMAG